MIFETDGLTQHQIYKKFREKRGFGGRRASLAIATSENVEPEPQALRMHTQHTDFGGSMNFDNLAGGFEGRDKGDTVENLDDVEPRRTGNEFSFGKHHKKLSQFKEAKEAKQATKPFAVENHEIMRKIEELTGQVCEYKAKLDELQENVQQKDASPNQRISSVEKTRQRVEARLLQDGQRKGDRNKKYHSVDGNGPNDGFDAEGSIEESIQKSKGNHDKRKQAAIDRKRREKFKGPSLNGGLADKISEASSKDCSSEAEPKNVDVSQYEQFDNEGGNSQAEQDVGEVQVQKEEWETQSGAARE